MFPATGIPSYAKPGLSVLIKNADAAETLYVGGSDVDAVDGFPLAAGESVRVQVYGKPIYCVGSDTLTAYILWGA